MSTSTLVKEIINVSLGDIIDVCSHDGLEGFLDLLAERIGHPLLMEIDYKLVKVNHDQTIKFEVTGDVSMEEEDDVEESRPEA